MQKQLINKVPIILKNKGISVDDFRWGARISLNTAKRWADYDSAQLLYRIDIPIIINIANYLNVDVSDMFEIVDAP